MLQQPNVAANKCHLESSDNVCLFVSYDSVQFIDNDLVPCRLYIFPLPLTFTFYHIKHKVMSICNHF